MPNRNDRKLDSLNTFFEKRPSLASFEPSNKKLPTQINWLGKARRKWSST